VKIFMFLMKPLKDINVDLTQTLFDP